MPLIKNGAVVEETAIEACTLDEFIENADARVNEQCAVRLEPADQPEKLEPYLDKIDRIDVTFPRYADGRGYSQAQYLRRRMGYKGELRAVGDVLRDQLLNMARSGFDAYEIEKPDAAESFAAAMKEYSSFYQPAADGEKIIFARRHA